MCLYVLYAGLSHGKNHLLILTAYILGLHLSSKTGRFEAVEQGKHKGGDRYVSFHCKSIPVLLSIAFETKPLCFSCSPLLT